MSDERPSAVRPGGTNTLQLGAPAKIRFFVCPHASVAVADDFPASSLLEPTGFAPAMHREVVELLHTAGLRPPGAGLLVVRLHATKTPKDDHIDVTLRDIDDEVVECATLTVSEHAQPAQEDGCVDFVLGLVFGDPVDLPKGKPFQGIHLVDVSPGDSSAAPETIHIGGGSWGEVVLPVHEFQLEFERY
jgi:hypothetical protein